MRRYVVAIGLVGLSLWTLHQIFSAFRYGYIYTLAVKHSAHLIVFEDSPFLLVTPSHIRLHAFGPDHRRERRGRQEPGQGHRGARFAGAAEDAGHHQEFDS